MIVSIVTTVDSRETLEKIGRDLLERRLVACIQVVGPVRSSYWWKGRLEEAEEWLGIFKTRRDLSKIVERELEALHPYEVPEIAVMEIDRVLPSYEKWVIEETVHS
jgi:periplasmic divalent cation tolerance protein